MFNWANYLKLADNLLEQDNEAAFRSAVSRAYYAAYNRARQKLIEEGLTYRADPSEPSKHKAVWDDYRNTADNTRRKVGNDGDRLRRSRAEADYNASTSVTQTHARIRVNNAKELYTSIERL